MAQIPEKDEIELDIGKILKALVRNRLRIVVSAAVGTAAAFLLALMMTPRYQSAVTFYIKNSVRPSSDGSITAADITASRELLDSYIVILQAEETLDAILRHTGVNKTQKQLREMIHASSVNSTEFLRVEVTGTDPREATCIATAIGEILPLRISGILEETSVRIVDAALIPFAPVSPGYELLILGGFGAGLGISVFCVIAGAVLDGTIRSRRDVEKVCTHRILSQVDAQDLYTADGYRQLRSKLRLSFPEDAGALTIGVTSPLPREGKTTVALKLARSLRKQGKRVLVMDCDLIHSQMTRQQNWKDGPGLSAFLEEKCTLNQTLRRCAGEGGEPGFPVITAGEKTEAYAELLTSERFRTALRAARNLSQLVILDLPALGEASETAEIARETDGILLVVRQDRCTANALRSAVEQLEFAGAAIVGIVYHTGKRK